MKFTPWIAALVITLGMGAIAGQDYAAKADRQDVEALSSRDFAGQAVCGPHATPDWLDDKTLQCLKEAP